MGAECNDPRCPLNRRGVPHRPHGDIEGDAVLDPCNDPQCALTRLGMRHNSHGPMDGPLPDAAAGAGRAEEKGEEEGAGPREAGGLGGGPAGGGGRGPAGQGADRNDGQAADGGAGQGAGGGAAAGPQPPGSSTSPEEILDEAARHLRQNAGRPGAAAAAVAAAAGARRAGCAREAERILGATDPHGILGIPRGATIEQARSSYKSLVKRHDAARGIIHKSPPEREKSNLIMAKINCAFEAFKTARAPRP